VFLGIISVAKEDIESTSGLQTHSQLLQEAQNNICDTFQDLFNKLHPIISVSKRMALYLSKKKIPQINEPLTIEILSDPSHPVVELCLYLYSLDSFISTEINRAQRQGDLSRV
jgi:hypothetical protein